MAKTIVYGRKPRSSGLTMTAAPRRDGGSRKGSLNTRTWPPWKRRELRGFPLRDISAAGLLSSSVEPSYDTVPGTATNRQQKGTRGGKNTWRVKNNAVAREEKRDRGGRSFLLLCCSARLSSIEDPSRWIDAARMDLLTPFPSTSSNRNGLRSSFNFSRTVERLGDTRMYK